MELIFAFIFIGAFLFIKSLLPSLGAGGRGTLGERKVAKILSQLPISEYAVINDISFQTEYGSVQIDHIVISLYGIFVIETKNYSGWILGGEKSDYWTKNMYGKKYHFYNPIKQNYAHISALKNILKLPREFFISLIVFPQEATIKTLTSEYVIYFEDIIPTIQSYTKKIFSISQVDKMTNQLLSLQSNSDETKETHIEYVKDRKSFFRQAVSQGICPYCGHMLKLKKGKYGQFIGCSHYPKCKYTHRL